MSTEYKGTQVAVTLGVGTGLPSAVDVSDALRVLAEIKAQPEDDRIMGPYHIKADEVLCDILNALGLANVVDAYNAIDKWYE